MSDLFAGQTLFRNGSEGTFDAAKELEGKIAGIYFSAHWCPPCRRFTPVLQDFYNELSGNSGGFEVVFTSSDRSAKDQQSYLKEAHGAWLYLGHGDPFVSELKDKYEIEGIPTLTIVKANGDVISEDGVMDVVEKSPSQALAAWRSA